MADKKDILKSAIDKVKMVDAGVKDKYGNIECCSKPVGNEPKVYYPNLYLDIKEAPMLSGSEVGDEVTLLIKTHITSHSKNENYDRKDEKFSLEIKEIGVVSTEKEKED